MSLNPDAEAYLAFLRECDEMVMESGGYLPDDCTECAACSAPMMACGSLCNQCLRELENLERQSQ